MRRRAVAAALLVLAAASVGAETETVRLLAPRVERVPETPDDPLWKQAPVATTKAKPPIEHRALHDATQLAILTAEPPGVRTFSLVEPKHDLRRPLKPEGAPYEIELVPERAFFDFEGTEVGTGPKGFAAGRTGGGPLGTWKVVEATGAPSGTRVLAQTDADATSYRFPVLVAAAPKAGDLRVTVRFRAVSGEVDQAGGLVVRQLDANNYYVVRANVLEDNVRLYRVADGKREQLASADVPVAPDVWHSLTLEVRGTKLVATFDGTTRLEADDGRITGPGLGGLWTKADSVTWFDDLEVVALYD